jgi:molybdopterin-guanine dinucleotide biosynthesis protein A
MGPLAGIHAGLAWVWANRPEHRFVITVAADTPFFPADLVSRFCAATSMTDPKLVVARSECGVHPVFGLWPVSLAPHLEDSLRRGARKALDFVAAQQAKEVAFPPIEIGGRAVDPFFNINRPEDLTEAEALLSATAPASRQP